RALLLHSFPTRRSSDLVQDHALPDQEAGERDDERGNADERDDRPLHATDYGADGDGGQYREDAVRLPTAAGKLELRHDERSDARSEEHTSELQSPDHLV